MMLSLTWDACIKLMVVIVFFHASRNIITKLQEKYCSLCKTTDSCCK